MTRDIKIYSTLGNLGTITTNATTFSEIQSVLEDKVPSLNSLKVLVGETKNELSEGSAILPEGDFKIFLVPKATKSGSDNDIIGKLYKLSDLFCEVGSNIDSIAKQLKDVVDADDEEMEDDEREAINEIKRLTNF